MKKAFSTLAATVLLGVTCAGFTACKGLSIPKGDEVNEEQWKEIFEDSGKKVKNYTWESSSESTQSLNGTVTKYKWEDNNRIYKKIGDATVKTEKESSASTNRLYDEEGGRYYEESESSTESCTKVDDEKENKSDSKRTSKRYYTLSEEKEDVKKYWRAEYSETDRSNSGEDGEGDEYEKNNWKASEINYFADNSINANYSFYVTNDENAKWKNVSELYGKFTFSNGFYTAKLYDKVNFYYSNSSGVSFNIYEYIECTVTVSVNAAEKCVIGYATRCDAQGSLTKEDDKNGKSYNLQYTYKDNYVRVITDIKTTDASEKVNKDIIRQLKRRRGKRRKQISDQAEIKSRNTEPAAFAVGFCL